MSFTPHEWTDKKTRITAEIMQSIEAELVSLRGDMMLAAHPVGSIYVSVENIDPGTIFGGRWVAWGSGRVPVGVDASDSDFNAAEKAGGSKELQAHTHTTPNHTHTITTASAGSHSHNALVTANAGTGSSRNALATSGTAKGGMIASGGSHTHTINQTASGGGVTGSTGAGNGKNLPPYITCYMFKRIE